MRETIMYTRFLVVIATLFLLAACGGGGGGGSGPVPIASIQTLTESQPPAETVADQTARASGDSRTVRFTDRLSRAW